MIGQITPGVRTAPGDAEAARRRTREELDAWWSDLRQLQVDLAPLWPEGVSALDAVREQRRER